MSGGRVGNTPKWLTTQQCAACRSVGSDPTRVGARSVHGTEAELIYRRAGGSLRRPTSVPAPSGSKNPCSNGGLEEEKQRLTCDLSATRAEPRRPLISISYSYDWSERGDLNSRPPVPQSWAVIDPRGLKTAHKGHFFINLQ
jgi:hypothetical protein